MKCKINFVTRLLEIDRSKYFVTVVLLFNLQLDVFASGTHINWTQKHLQKPPCTQIICMYKIMKEQKGATCVEMNKLDYKSML